ncbi:MAG: UDP-2,3-diacylglucosamine diphosphatase [Rudaea sp.]|uniref:UDP-2,3-diacylglucosamine diphosphatase n=1 Tax=Rudaea sp. TaxID=2136325 RepID=UPI0039E6C48C
MPPRRYRSIFISDVHLGLRDCQAGYLLDFLRETASERLYLVGDIVDLENMLLKPYWHASHTAVLTELFAIAARGTRVTFIPGNHDAALRRFAGQRFGGIEIALDAVHVGADGRRYKVSHGDEFDGGHAAPAWLMRVGEVLQRFVGALNRVGNALRRRLGFDYRTISLGIKLRIGTARRFIEDFETRVAEYAREKGFDGHICGHIHRGRIRDEAGTLYLNDGDWVEHCTVLVEHHDGAMEVLHWSERELSVANSPAARIESEPLPVAA